MGWSPMDVFMDMARYNSQDGMKKYTAMSTIHPNLIAVVRVRARWVYYGKCNERQNNAESFIVNTCLMMAGNRVHRNPSAGIAAVR